MPEMQVQSLGGEDPLKKEMTTPSGTFAWKIPWTEEPGRVQPMGSQGVVHYQVTKHTRVHLHFNMELFLPYLGTQLSMNLLQSITEESMEI